MHDDWNDLFIAAAGAAAALAGLIIVAMSVNIKEIIAIPSMPSRAGAAIASLVLIVVTSIAGLVPDQPGWAYGLEVMVFGLLALGFAVDSGVRTIGEHGATVSAPGGRPLAARVLSAALAAVQVAPFIVGGALLVGGAPSGLGWVAAGILLVFIGSVLSAWVLLVEILR